MKGLNFNSIQEFQFMNLHKAINTRKLLFRNLQQTQSKSAENKGKQEIKLFNHWTFIIIKLKFQIKIIQNNKIKKNNKMNKIKGNHLHNIRQQIHLINHIMILCKYH